MPSAAAPVKVPENAPQTPKAPEMALKAPQTPASGTSGRPDPRRRVLDAAIACFTRNGFHGTSMHEICAEANMSPGALYRYFPSKDAIILTIVEEERSARMQLLALMERADGFIAGLTRMGQALFSGELPMVCVELGPEISAEAARNPKLKAKFDEVEAEMSGAIRAAFVAAQARGELDPAIDPDVAMTMIDAIGDGLLLRNRLSPEIPLGDMMPALSDLIGRMFAAPRTVSTDPSS